MHGSPDPGCDCVMQGIIDADKAIKGAFGLVTPFGAELSNEADSGQSHRAAHNIGMAPTPQ